MNKPVHDDDGSRFAVVDHLPERAVVDTSAKLMLVVTELLEQVRHEGAGASPLQVLGHVVDRAAELVPGAEWCSVTVIRGKRLSTLAVSHDSALQADEIQYALRSGPCVDAARKDHVYLTGSVVQDPRWPEFGRRVAAAVGVRSMLAHRLTLLDGGDTVAAVNLYSTEPDAFGDDSLRAGLVLATQCSLLVAAHLHHDDARSLQTAVESAREIGAAIGILMSRHAVTRDQAFAMLRIVSQNHNRKIRDLAAEVLQTRRLPAAVPEPGPAG